MQMWVVLIALYGIFKGLRDPVKKKALEKNGVLETLFLYVLFGFLMCIPFSPDAFEIPPKYIGFIFIKSAVVFVAWTASFVSVKKLPVSLYGILDTSRVIFSILFGVILLGESITLQSGSGLLLVVAGLYMVNAKKGGDTAGDGMKYVWITLLSCVFNAVSGTMDKMLMSTGEITSSQLQFWFMLLLSVMYFVYIKARGERINFRTGLKNTAIYIISALLILGDRILFVANSDPRSMVTVMTLIKQCSVPVTIISGMLVYKEKNILYKLICAAIIIAGILIATL